MMFWRLGGKGSLNEWMNYEGVCRTAPATPSLLNIFKKLYLPSRKSLGPAILTQCWPRGLPRLFFVNWIFFLNIWNLFCLALSVFGLAFDLHWTKGKSRFTDPIWSGLSLKWTLPWLSCPVGLTCNKIYILGGIIKRKYCLNLAGNSWIEAKKHHPTITTQWHAYLIDFFFFFPQLFFTANFVF